MSAPAAPFVSREATLAGRLSACRRLFLLTLRRQFFSRQTIVGLALAVLCCLIVLAWSFHREPTTRRFASNILVPIYIAFLLPVLSICYGASAVGGEREDRTLIYLLITSIPKPLIYLMKFLATQVLVTDNENQTSYIDLPNHGSYWWYWYGDVVEANAYFLKLLTRTNVQDERAAGLVKYLLNNRRHGSYWNSTRDTAVCIEALAEYLVASGEATPSMLVEVWVDGEQKQSVEITPEVLFTFDNSFVIEGEALAAGEHTIELCKKPLGVNVGAGGAIPLSPLYFNAYLTNFTLEDPITAAGLEIKVQRAVYKLVQREGATDLVQGASGQALDQKADKYDRVLLEDLTELKSGDLVEIELEIDSKNDYEYIVFEDMKAAGCEPVDVRSGYTSDGLGAYVEFRDEKVAFFLRSLARGKHSVSYRVRAEIPGKFSALPTKGYAMYAPELKANSDEFKFLIAD